MNKSWLSVLARSSSLADQHRFCSLGKSHGSPSMLPLFGSRIWSGWWFDLVGGLIWSNIGCLSSSQLTHIFQVGMALAHQPVMMVDQCLVSYYHHGIVEWNTSTPRNEAWFFPGGSSTNNVRTCYNPKMICMDLQCSPQNSAVVWGVWIQGWHENFVSVLNTSEYLFDLIWFFAE